MLSFAPTSFKQAVRHWMAGALGVPYPKYGIPGTLVAELGSARDLCVVDVGAHVGAFTTGLDQLCGVRRALLCEANPDKAECLRQKFAGRSFEIFEGAICDQVGEADFHIASFDAISSLLPIMAADPNLAAIDTSRRSTVKVKTATLDSLCVDIGFGSIDILKIDVQGAELLVLEGASVVLSRTARIWIEASLKPLYEGSALFGDIYRFLTGRGFVLRALEPGFRGSDGELLQVDLLFVRGVRGES